MFKRKTFHERLRENLEAQQAAQPLNQKGLVEKGEDQDIMRRGLPGLAMRELNKKDIRPANPSSSGVVRN